MEERTSPICKPTGTPLLGDVCSFSSASGLLYVISQSKSYWASWRRALLNQPSILSYNGTSYSNRGRPMPSSMCSGWSLQNKEMGSMPPCDFTPVVGCCSGDLSSLSQGGSRVHQQAQLDSDSGGRPGRPRGFSCFSGPTRSPSSGCRGLGSYRVVRKQL